MNDTPTTVCWILTEGMIGTQNQCLALAQANGFSQPVIKKIGLRQPLRAITPHIRFFHPVFLTATSDPLTGPWPDVLIASGRKAIAAALWVKKQSGGKTVLVIVQSPVIKDKNFDLVLAPRHDNYNAPNAMPITGALSHITPAKLADAQNAIPALQDLPQPRVADRKSVV